MNIQPFSRFYISFISLVLTLICTPVRSQMIPDATLGSESSIVINNGISDQIAGGAVRNNNLFHSFQEFNVNEGRGAYFINPAGVDNIINRVTGGNSSDILGKLGVIGGNANLLLINPNGIIFGPNSSLDIGGSFLASTANSINFADGDQFSATNPQPVPLLTVKVPIGLGFTTGTSGPIKVEGYGHNLLTIATVGAPVLGSGQSSMGLKTQPGKTIALVGGQVNFDGGILTTPSGRIEVGSIATGLVGMSSTPNGLFLSYDKVQNYQDIQLDKVSLLDASGFWNGDIFLQGGNVTLTDASLAIVSNFGNLSLGKIFINATEKLQATGIKEYTRSTNSNITLARGIATQNFAAGKGADIVVFSKQISVQDFAGVGTQNSGFGSGGNISLIVKDSTQIFSKLALKGLTIGTVITSTSGAGQGGNLSLSTKNLSIEDGGILAAESFGSGNGGNVTINASDSVGISGGALIDFDNKFVNNSFWPSFLGALTTSSGNAGNVVVNTNHLRLENGSRLDSSTLSSGFAGNLTINSTNSIDVSGIAPGFLSPTLISSSANVVDPFFNQIFSLSAPLAGKSGYATINTNQLSVRERAQISVRNDGITDGGTLQITANSINLDRGSITASTASGKGGNITLKSENILLHGNSNITATAGNTGAGGNGGNITIDTDTLAALENSEITANAFKGRGGNIQINTQGLFLSPDSEIRASSGRGPQFDGIVQVNTPDIDFTRATVQPVAGPESPEIVSVCQGRSSTVANELIDTGTGGVPASPSASLSSDPGWQDNSLPIQVTKNFKKPEQSTAAKPTQIVEAQGWKRNANGTVSMMTDTSGVVLYSSLVTPSCLKDSPMPIQEVQNESQDTIKVQRFLFKGNRAFSTKKLEAVVAPYKRRKITFTQLLQARAAVTKFYTEAGYITSGALIPIKENQEIQSSKGAVTIQVVEGTLEKINVSGSARLQGYVRSRLESAGSPALNRDRLEEALRLLQADPKIASISANLVSSSWIDKTLLEVDVKAKQPFRVETSIDNERSPAVGSLQRRAQITQSNLLGLGDELNLGYRNTDGSDAIQTSYTLPINPRNGTLQFSYADISSDIVERPFNELDIISDSRSYELSLRQPLLQKASTTSTKEFALGVTASREESESSLAGEPYPLSLGADDQGRIRISAVRFFQDWTQRSGREVLFARSQFSLGVGTLDATINANAPDSRFFAWRGQAVWLRRLAEDTTLLLRADLQLADRPLVPLEQFSLGGATTVRGYRQDALLGNNGFLISAELRLPIISGQSGDFHIIPFVDVGTAWDDSDRESEITDTLDTNTLASIGLGLQYQLGELLTARLDWGIPLNDLPSNSNSTWQENGLYFSLRFQPF